METNTDSPEKISPDKFRKMVVSGLAIFCCFVLSPLIGSFLNSRGISYAFVYILVVFCTNILPLIIIALGFRNFSPVTGVMIIVLAAGVFRVLAEVFLSPVPLDLLSTPAYYIDILLYCILLSVISIGVSLFDERKPLAAGIIIMGIFLYLWFIREIFFTSIGLVSGG